MPISGKPALQYVIEEAVASGIDQVVCIISSRKSILRKYFALDTELEQLLCDAGRNSSARIVESISKIADVRFVEQLAPRGLGDAVRCARDTVGDQPFAVMLPDNLFISATPCLRQLVDCHAKSDASVIAIAEMHERQSQMSGMVALDTAADLSKAPGARVSALVEKPPLGKAPSRYGIIGRYILSPAIFDYLDGMYRDSTKELELTTALNDFCQGNALYAFRVDAKVYDVGEKSGFVKATLDFALQDPELRHEVYNHLAKIVNTSEMS
jgi:UTP--glucose-1-phosphate uridylyltransferase